MVRTAVLRDLVSNLENAYARRHVAAAARAVDALRPAMMRADPPPPDPPLPLRAVLGALVARTFPGAAVEVQHYFAERPGERMESRIRRLTRRLARHALKGAPGAFLYWSRLTKPQRPRRRVRLPVLQRPKVRGDCLPGGINEARPCPYASCRYHLGIHVDPVHGSVQEMVGWENGETCALDVADRGESSQHEIAALTGMARQAITDVEENAGEHLRRVVRSGAIPEDTIDALGIGDDGED